MVNMINALQNDMSKKTLDPLGLGSLSVNCSSSRMVASAKNKKNKAIGVRVFLIYIYIYFKKKLYRLVMRLLILHMTGQS